MRSVFVLASIFIYSFANAQDLKNTEWIKIKAQRKDGSRIVDRNNRGNGCMHYYFTADSVHISANVEYSTTQKYLLNDNTLSVGNLINYHIDSLNDVFMGVTEIPAEALPDDKINSYVFINADYIYDYVNKTHIIPVTADSTIEYNDYFFPAYQGDMGQLFSKFADLLENKSLRGSITISGNGTVKNVSITSVKNFSDKQVKNVIDILNATSGSWILPPSPKLFQFKFMFLFSVFGSGRIYGTSFSLQTEDTLLPIKNLTKIDKNELVIHFNNGLRLFKNGKFDKAVTQFLACIKIDATYVDAYYDLGYSYQKMGNTELACETWKKLKEMEQKEGERLYNANCK